MAQKLIHGLSHSELVSIASRWLKNSAGCSVVISEMCSQSEEPDAIGWRAGRSILIECKATKDDFHRDRSKWMRGSFNGMDFGMGVRRYYMTPSGMIAEADLPRGWGLLEVSFVGRVKKVAESVTWVLSTASMRSELGLVLSALRRMQNGETACVKEPESTGTQG